MAVLSSATFRAGLSDLPPAERARFVADLFRARGWTARIEDGDDPVVTLSRGDRDRRRLLVHDPGAGWLPRGPRVPDDVDAVVTPRAGRPRGLAAGVTVIDGDALYERAVHGIATADRERLFREYLGRSALVSRGDGERAGASDGGGRSRRSRRLHAVVGLVALALVATAVAGVPGPPGDPGTRQSVDGGAGPATPTPFVGSGSPPASTRTATPVPAPSAPPADAYPPGVNASGLVDADALVAAHTGAVAGSHYRMVLTYAEYDDIGKTGQRQLVAVVGPPDRVRTSVTASGGGFGVSDPVPRREVYAEGTTLYRRYPRYNGTLYRRDSGSLAPADVVVFGQSYLSEALTADSSRLVRTTASDGDRLFRIAFDGDDDPQTVDARGLLVVDHRGVVRSLQRRYAANASVELSATVSLRYEFGNVNVERPPWLPRAEAALGENTSAFVPTSRTRGRTANANATDANATAP